MDWPLEEGAGRDSRHVGNEDDDHASNNFLNLMLENDLFQGDSSISSGKIAYMSATVVRYGRLCQHH